MTSGSRDDVVTRPLSAIERRMFLLSRGGVGNVVQCVRIRGPVDEARLRPAIDKLRRQHPLLSARVVRRHGRLMFTTDGAAPLSFRAIAGDGSENGWMEVAAAEQAVPIDAATGPLFRFVLLEQPGGEWADLVITNYHAAGDAKSFYLVLRDLCMFAGFPDTPVDPAPALPALAAMLPAFDPAPPLPPRPAEFPPPPSPMRPAAPSEISISTAELPPACVRAFARECKRQGVTVHAALCAAMAQPFAALYAGRDTLTISTPVDFRRSLRHPSVDRGLGNLHGFVAMPVEVATPRPLWERAHTIARQLSVNTTTDGLLRRAWQLEAMDLEEPDDDAFLARTQSLKGTSGDLSISNVGRQPLPTRYGDLTIAAMYAGSCLPGELILCVCTLDDTMYLTLMSNSLSAAANAGARRALSAAIADITAHAVDPAG